MIKCRQHTDVHGAAAKARFASNVIFKMSRNEGFTITLNFGDNPETLYVPYDSIQTFVDPSVEFGLRFETQDSDQDDDAPEAPMDEMVQAAPAPEPRHDAEVVSLDKFRK